jgi:hypothetical protein
MNRNSVMNDERMLGKPDVALKFLSGVVHVFYSGFCGLCSSLAVLSQPKTMTRSNILFHSDFSLSCNYTADSAHIIAVETHSYAVASILNNDSRCEMLVVIKLLIPRGRATLTLSCVRLTS